MLYICFEFFSANIVAYICGGLHIYQFYIPDYWLAYFHRLFFGQQIVHQHASIVREKRKIEVELIYVVEERFIAQYKQNINIKMRLIETV